MCDLEESSEFRNGRSNGANSREVVSLPGHRLPLRPFVDSASMKENHDRIYRQSKSERLTGLISYPASRLDTVAHTLPAGGSFEFLGRVVLEGFQ